jgi:hypothetical protein
VPQIFSANHRPSVVSSIPTGPAKYPFVTVHPVVDGTYLIEQGPRALPGFSRPYAMLRVAVRIQRLVDGIIQVNQVASRDGYRSVRA